ncbi:hypothetical protein LTS16_008031 [Friedmanniomyces endolithicus]|uniref:Uncharacterized protein n=1 Tax=Friedmanniomyces endolithicus TaxID=329885 RepID=A0AAN6FGY8_9PEZI|nr:hypothetical protein LTS09_016002 [Friedmanniomyces endolithicus]KAK0267910.1 hypothetical protein LTR35_015968 [Friedmanniomyces endolithicus]KAK0269067.1 hypothetical protein LTS00_017401 [Friedmanniomyces endolithicus]KAK0301868.1 hypothetical protein LTR01_009108 [Friedmanniomyces endolithicus]KAK0318225.1 hypothetical protein LTR82_010924 [Friedmanniomyces endolithicus]
MALGRTLILAAARCRVTLAKTRPDISRFRRIGLGYLVLTVRHISARQKSPASNMAHKRPASDMDVQPLRPLRTTQKRARISASDNDEHSDSSALSSGSVSVASALESSPPASPQQQRRRNSSVSSLPSSTLDSDGEADDDSLSSSSAEESSEDLSDGSDEEVVTSVHGTKKPAMAKGKARLLEGAQDLSARISALLPRLAAANSALLDTNGEGSHGHSLEDVEEGEGYIEMDLGLGVLEEKTGGDGDSDSSEDESGEDGGERAEGDDVPVSSGAVGRDRGQTASDTHILGKLMGQRKVERKAGVEALN